MSVAACRSLLFVRADEPALLAAALASEADGVVADLEDATPAGAKERARAVVADAYGNADDGPKRLVRVNPVDGPLAEADLALVAGLRIDAVVVPHATVDAVDAVASLGLPTVAVVESARGLREAYDIAARPHVVGIQLGAKDLGLDLGLEPRADGLELLHARSRLVVDAAAARLEGLWDRVVAGGDRAALEADAAFGRSLGFRGKSTLAPGDAAVINRVFAR